MLSISAQRHSARSRAAFHCARECWSPEWGDDWFSLLSLWMTWLVEACAMISRHCSEYHQSQIFRTRKMINSPSQHDPVEDWRRRASHALRAQGRNRSSESMLNSEPIQPITDAKFIYDLILLIHL